MAFLSWPFSCPFWLSLGQPLPVVAFTKHDNSWQIFFVAYNRFYEARQFLADFSVPVGKPYSTFVCSPRWTGGPRHNNNRTIVSLRVAIAAVKIRAHGVSAWEALPDEGHKYTPLLLPQKIRQQPTSILTTALQTFQPTLLLHVTRTVLMIRKDRLDKVPALQKIRTPFNTTSPSETIPNFWKPRGPDPVRWWTKICEHVSFGGTIYGKRYSNLARVVSW
jgi:hypothetical protein